MRGKLFVFFVGLAGLAGYLVSPLMAAWEIKEAIHTSDTAVLEKRIEWPAIKQTLRSSMETYALRSPGAEGLEPASAEASNPSVWQRIRAAYGRQVVASIVETMVTPTGLPKLLKYRQGYHKTIRGVPDEPQSASFVERAKVAWSRVERAEFLSPTRFALRVRDRFDPDKSFAGELELQGLSWRLVSLKVVGKPKPSTIVRAWSAMKQAAIR